MLNLCLMSLATLLALTFTQTRHPLASGLIILIQTLMICLITGLSSQSFWFSYILFLVFLGGLLVLFIYVTSLASNEMFVISVNYMLTIILILSISMLALWLIDPTILLNKTHTLNASTLTSYSQPFAFKEPLIKLFNYPTSLITLAMVLYLFLTLIAVVKITKIHQGPLRQSN
uniref:NADH-ubiquinone oxidoreductase chain 6 n=1 Tax=Neoperlops gressitti TaxID=2684670 RepID=A0A6B9P9Y1_9NEOP|nr:NADH dehydrogenase subunit 6 [Neoperlops gressitti]